MYESVFRARDIPEADRFDLWRAFMAEAVCPQDMSTDDRSSFDAEALVLRLGEINVWLARSQQVSWQRTPRTIRECDPEFYHLSLTLRGTLSISQAGRSAVHGPHDMYIVNTSRPWDCHNTQARAVCLEVPRRLLPLPSAKVDRLVTSRLSGRDGPGALLAGALRRLTRDTAAFRPADGPRLETVVLDLFAATLAHRLDLDDDLPPETHSRSLALRVQSFARHRLRDPDLTPRVIAAAHHISVSHLHRVFAALGHATTLAAWIREQRLEGARRDLADPVQRHTTVRRIAARWGFTEAAVFSRAFRTAYGVSPRDYRHHALGDGGDPPG
ncbi:helix-turn-helix domain-containing protein [Streptomyces sp. B6B3]|uniref:AraC-like ligand-binding domain-containing protein n=1 Tax=Streptomyces sp. B6B3 TaxID=3153570 RepID=UPI00325F04C7